MGDLPKERETIDYPFNVWSICGPLMFGHVKISCKIIFLNKLNFPLHKMQESTCHNVVIFAVVV